MQHACLTLQDMPLSVINWILILDTIKRVRAFRHMQQLLCLVSTSLRLLPCQWYTCQVLVLVMLDKHGLLAGVKASISQCL